LDLSELEFFLRRLNTAEPWESIATFLFFCCIFDESYPSAVPRQSLLSSPVTIAAPIALHQRVVDRPERSLFCVALPVFVDFLAFKLYRILELNPKSTQFRERKSRQRQAQTAIDERGMPSRY
jgi:hypothetical protein